MAKHKVSQNDKKSARGGSKKKQSNFLNYKKQINTYSRTKNLDHSGSMTKYFYSNRSINEPSSQVEDSEEIWNIESRRESQRFQKPSLRLNVYESLPKKSLNERKDSIKGNYSVLTDNYIKTESSLAGKYSSNYVLSDNESRYSKSKDNYHCLIQIYLKIYFFPQ